MTTKKRKSLRLYFELGCEENCYPLDYFQDRINDGEKEIPLILAEVDYGSGYSWCKDLGEIIERGDGACGKYNCKKYRPRNGKSGRCRLSINTYTYSGKEFILTKNGINQLT